MSTRVPRGVSEETYSLYRSAVGVGSSLSTTGTHVLQGKEEEEEKTGPVH